MILSAVCFLCFLRRHYKLSFAVCISLDYIFSLCDDPRGRYKNNAVSSGSGRYSIFFAIKIIRLTTSGL